MVIWHLPVLGHDHAAIVKHEPTTIEPRRDNGVIFLPDVVAQDDDPKIVSGNSCFLQGNELCDRVIFALRHLSRVWPETNTRRPGLRMHAASSVARSALHKSDRSQLARAKLKLLCCCSTVGSYQGNQADRCRYVCRGLHRNDEVHELKPARNFTASHHASEKRCDRRRGCDRRRAGPLG